jgi:predicted ATPase
LTILAGANSSGKSSIMQPLLLLKQTLEAPYDPGALKFDGPNVTFTSVEQILSQTGKGINQNSFHVGVVAHKNWNLTTHFIKRKRAKQLEIEKMVLWDEIYNEKMSYKRLLSYLPSTYKTFEAPYFKNVLARMNENPRWVVSRNRCFLDLQLVTEGGEYLNDLPLSIVHSNFLRNIIHLPGLRGNPARTYPRSAVGTYFPGTFDKYFASVLAKWDTSGENEKLLNISRNLKKLRLTTNLQAHLVNATQVEIQVSRFSQTDIENLDDMVSIADVGLGVSQTLPVLVALQVAKPEQLVYLEQPEIHLHPRAQTTLAEIISDASKRGVRVVVETHSDLLILGIQTLVAEGKLSPELVKLHWFSRDETGATTITSADLDETGAFGEEWPEDFADVRLQAQQRYLDAAEAKLLEA